MPMNMSLGLPETDAVVDSQLMEALCAIDSSERLSAIKVVIRLFELQLEHRKLDIQEQTTANLRADAAKLNEEIAAATGKES